MRDESRPPHRAGEPVRGGIPEHGRVPRYYEVKASLVALVEELGEGTPLPPERELAERYGVSRVTLRQAVGGLVLEGRLQRRQGSRSVVAPPKLVQPLALVSYTEGVRSRGLRPSRLLVTSEVVAADAELAADLRIEAGDDVLHIERVLMADGERIGLKSTYLSAVRFPGLLAEFEPDSSLYAFLGERHGIVFAEARERVETVLSTPREALLLGTNPSLPMMLIHRVSQGADGLPIERVRSLFRGDRFSFEAHLRAD